ncbi:MAG: glycosyltransferase [Candidatus Nanopelagicales bacterium]|nr:glycosyltransferase [Candidatus Nanopelagicales bacterium]
MLTVDLDSLPETVEAGAFVLIRDVGRPVCLLRVTRPVTSSQLRDVAEDGAAQLPGVTVLQRAKPRTRPAGEIITPRDAKSARPTLSIVIPCARGGSSAARLIASLAGERDWIDQILVIPNGCDPVRTRDAVAEAIASNWGRTDPIDWDVIESPIGLSRARNTGLRAATGELTAMVDDDVVVLPGWGAAIAAAATKLPQAWAFNALVLSDSPATDAAKWFEHSGGFRKGLDSRIFLPREFTAAQALREVTAMGTGATCVLRTQQARELGGYGERLGAGTSALGGEDLNMLLDVLDAGGAVAYIPAITVLHPPPDSWEAIRRQTFRYGIGLSALVTHRVATARITIRQLLSLCLAAIVTVASRSGYVNEHQERFPLRLRVLELGGLATGPLAYARSALALPRQATGGEDSESEDLRHRTVRSGYLLIVNTVATALLGLGYWAIAARVMPPAALGVGAALIALITALSTAGQLNFSLSLPVLLPRAGKHRRRLLLRSYGAALALTLAIGIGALAIAPGAMSALPGGVTGATPFLVALCLWSIFSIEDGALVAANRTWVVPVENSAFGVLKVAALLGLAVLVTGGETGRSETADAAILAASWYLPLALIIPVVTVILLRTLAAPAPRPDSDQLRVRQFVAFDYVGSLLLQAGSTALPFIVAVALDPTAAALFVVAWTLSTSVDVLTMNLSWPMSVAIASSPKDAAATSRAVALRISLLIVPAIGVGIVGAPWLLQIFGQEYAEGSVGILRLLLFASIPRAAATFAMSGLRARGKARAVAGVQGVATVITLAIGLGLAPTLGVNGFGIGWLIANLIAAALALAALRAVTGSERAHS